MCDNSQMQRGLKLALIFANSKFFTVHHQKGEQERTASRCEWYPHRVCLWYTAQTIKGRSFLLDSSVHISSRHNPTVSISS